MAGEASEEVKEELEKKKQEKIDEKKKVEEKTTVDKDGYELIIINYNNESFGFHVHRMVALMFIENPDRFTRTQVNHKNGNKLYNFYFNLEWTTPKENINHAWNHRLAKSSGEMNGNNVYKEKDIKRVCEMIESDYPLRVISEKTGVSYAMISLIYRKKFWTSISDNYDFSKYNYGRLYKNKNIVKICELLEKTNMSIKDIANECGVKRYKINDILRGKSFISISCNYDFSNRNNL